MDNGLGSGRITLTDEPSYSAERPSSCPRCGSGRVATILYGYPMESINLKNRVKAGEVVLGGCLVSNDDPRWRCMDCGFQIHQRSKRGVVAYLSKLKVSIYQT